MGGEQRFQGRRNTEHACLGMTVPNRDEAQLPLTPIEWRPHDVGGCPTGLTVKWSVK